MRKLIVVEGPDRTGKTTLARNLASRFNYFYVKLTAGGKLNLAMPEYHKAVLDFVEWNIIQRDQGVVLDRCWLSEMIYGGILREDEVRRFPFKEHDDRIRLLGGIYVVCDSRTVIERHAADRDASHPYTDEEFEMIVDGYRRIQSEHDITDQHWHFVDMDKYIHHLDLLANKIMLL